MTEPRINILGVGVATIDDLLVVRQFPKINEKQRILSSTRQCGGLTGTALVAAARLGCRCGYAATLGEGELSSYLRRELGREGITLLEHGDPEAGPYHSCIFIEEGTGERGVLSDNSRARPPHIGEAEMALAGEVDCLFVDHVFADALLELAREARRLGTPMVGDFERTTPGSRELMALVDHLILPLAYARQFLGEPVSAASAARILAGQPGRALACVTDGARGVWYALGEAPNRVLHQPIFPVACVVDSTGCGDVFHGVYAAGLVKGWPPAERIRRASAAAAIKTQKPGAQAGAPGLAELEAFLSTAAGEDWVR